MSRWFSNGTEGRAWEALWCHRCANDHQMHDPDDQSGGCEWHPILEREDTPLIDETDKFGFTFPPAVRCTKFTPCIPCGDGDVTLNEDGYPSPVRQREWMRPFGSDQPGVLITDQVLTAPGCKEDAT